MSAAEAGDGLAGTVLRFVGALRRAGLRVGIAGALDAVAALRAVGVERREDARAALAACLLGRPDDRALFDALFEAMWRPGARGGPPPEGAQASPARAADAARRAAEALEDAAAAPRDAVPETRVEADMRLAVSAAERLGARDFAQMTLAEQAQAQAALARMAPLAAPLPVRRSHPDPRGPLPDWRASFRAALRAGELRAPRRRARGARPPSLVALCDISGSMEAYSRMLLHFLHAAANARGPRGWGPVHAFAFGTRLTDVSRCLRGRDADAALRRVGAEVRDWRGGTRIGAALHAFNRDWSRRVLGRGAVVLLVTDGLDRDDPALLAREAERLRLSARRVVWVNPLLRWEGFAPKARGVRALLPHVDSLRAGHSLHSVAALAEALSRPDDAGDKPRLLRLLTA